MKKEKTKVIYVEVPKTEHIKFKVFASATGITMQKLIRSAVNHYIREIQEWDKGN